MKYIEQVNAKIGSDNSDRYSHGNIYPICAMPFGNADWTIQTDGRKGSWFYNPRDLSFEGIRLTHQPSPWVGDFGHMLFLPFSGEYLSQNQSWTSYRPKEATFTPAYIKVYEQRYFLDTEVTPTERGGYFRITNKGKMQTGFAVLPYAPSQFTLKGNKVKGYTTAQGIWGFSEIKEYFSIEFSAEIVDSFATEANGGIVLKFNEKQLTAKIATSFISQEFADLNLKNELSSDFDTVKKQVEEKWEEKLSLIEVSDENPEMKKTFYSCMYRVFLYPIKFYDVDEKGDAYHFNVDTGKVENGVFYTDNGFWDTYRTVYPLLIIIDPDSVKEMVQGYVNYANETGWLPKWLAPGEIGLMPGTLVEAVLADCAVKGILQGQALQDAYKAMLKSAYTPGEGRHGRQGISDYMKYGYIPLLHRECVNHTLDCAYGDFCIAQVAKIVGDEENAEKLYKRSKNFKNIFDKETGFMRGRDENGEHKASEFTPYEWGGENCEGSSWQNSFAVYHDIEGLAELYGGKENLIKRLDELFEAKPDYYVGKYAMEIHEMSEMACIDFGQMAISNQPSFHIPYIYAMLGEKKKTEDRVEELVKGAFTSADDGYPGDEDNGTMAAWYVFSCLGFYPVCPGKNEYVYSKPLFNEIKIKGKKI